MFSKRNFGLLLFAIFSTTVFAQEQALNTITKADLKRHLTFISSDDLQGRKVGVGDGLERTADYIAENAERIGLKPVNDSYSQKVDIFSIDPKTSEAYIEVSGQDEKFSVLNMNSWILDLTLDADLVFVGFGTVDEETGHNDYEGIDIAGKIVVISADNYKTFGDKDAERWNDKEEGEKRKIAFEKRAEAVIIVTSPYDKKSEVYSKTEEWMTRRTRYLLADGNENQGNKYFLATPEFADFLLGGKNKYKKYLSEISKTKTPKSFQLENKKVQLCVKSYAQLNHSRNIVGIVEGSDPVLKDEYVVYMAHYDHLGIGPDGDVYNGADDNGSGTTTLLEMAEAFSTMKDKPKRSILFLWVTSEEIGMFGSRFYAAHPLVPMEKTAACINLDMVGRVYEPRDSVWNKSPKMVKDFDGVFTLVNDVWPELQEISNSVCKDMGLVPDNSLPAKFIRASDHYNFHKNGVPILNVATGYHADYHKVSDEVSKINFDKMKRVADFCFTVGYEVANNENAISDRKE